ncbi:MAG: ParA family protein [Clostridia bacterium]|nr:ParA family protein [Clostridia bacterium]
MSAVCLAFANQKGGVGKTTCAINVAAELGKRGKRVLLVDMDPQGNATSGLGIAKKSVKISSYQVLIGESDAKSAILVTEFKNLSLIPSTISLVGAEFDLHTSEERGRDVIKALAPVKEDYDFILIDCPPTLGMLTINALAAADGVIIPIPCDFFSLEGLSQLNLTIKKVRSLYNPNLDITGLLLTMYNKRLLLTAQVESELRKYYSDKLFKTTISRSVKLAEAPGFGRPIAYFDPYGKGALEYREVVKELLLRV